MVPKIPRKAQSPDPAWRAPPPGVAARGPALTLPRGARPARPNRLPRPGPGPGSGPGKTRPPEAVSWQK